MALSDVASFSGLASGIQWRDMIDQIMALEARPITALEQKVSLSQARITTWGAFKTAVVSRRSTNTVSAISIL